MFPTICQRHVSQADNMEKRRSCTRIPANKQNYTDFITQWFFLTDKLIRNGTGIT